MPKGGHAMSTQHKARHAAAMAAPLRAIVGAVPVGPSTDGSARLQELLECGHTSCTTDAAQAQAFVACGYRRRCRQCASRRA